jgi:cytochrome b561
MTDFSTQARYTGVAMLLHWLLALGIFGAFGMGLYLDDLPLSPSKIQLINWHKWAGVCILFLSALRLLWRFTHRPPALPDGVARAMPGWQMAAYHGTHHLMYLLFFVVPLAGWAYSSARGYPIVLFGVLPLPDLVGKDEALAHTLKEVHELAAFALIGLAGLHIAAAIKHQLIDRDGLINRMRPGR